MSTLVPSPREDLAVVLAAVTAAIARLNDEHLAATGRPALHVGNCARGDLHDRLIELHVRAKALQQASDGQRDE